MQKCFVGAIASGIFGIGNVRHTRVEPCLDHLDDAVLALAYCFKQGTVINSAATWSRLQRALFLSRHEYSIASGDKSNGRISSAESMRADTVLPQSAVSKGRKEPLLVSGHINHLERRDLAK